MNFIQMDAINLHSRCTAKTVALVRGWGNCDLTSRCLASLRKFYSTDQLRIVYVDNGSPIKDYLNLLGQFPTVEFVRFPENYGSMSGNQSRI